MSNTRIYDATKLKKSVPEMSGSQMDTVNLKNLNAISIVAVFYHCKHINHHNKKHKNHYNHNNVVTAIFESNLAGQVWIFLFATKVIPRR